MFFRLIGVVLLTASCASFGGVYSDAVEKQSRCESAGNIAKTANGLSTEDVKASLAGIKKNVAEKKFTKEKGDDLAILVMFGKIASSKTDAYMKGWGWCMDQK